MPESLVSIDETLPPNVGIVSTTRLGGVSPFPWTSLNLGINTADSNENIESNRQILTDFLPERVQVQWLRQIHGTDSFEIEVDVLPTPPEADICYTTQKMVACAVLTADCLPILISDSKGMEVAAVHAGWRGLAAGVLAEAVAKFKSQPHELQIWIGPAISQTAFEVGGDVIEAMLVEGVFDEKNLELVTKPHAEEVEKYYLDLAKAARISFTNMGVQKISGGEYCTYLDSERFFSYRRDGETGRMASLIWINS